MLRVAGLGKIIADNLSKDIKIDQNILIKALLVHDMGNIVKFDFSVKTIPISPSKIAELRDVKDNFVQKYGADAHVVTEKILNKIDVSNSIIEITNSN